MNALNSLKRFVPCIAGLSLLTASASAQSFDASQVARNSALRDSPRYQELIRTRVSATQAPVRSLAAPTKSLRRSEARTHAALSGSPRVVEEFPELALERQARSVTTRPDPILVGPVHEGLASSPREIEVHRAHAHPGAPVLPAPAYQIAPLK